MEYAAIDNPTGTFVLASLRSRRISLVALAGILTSLVLGVAPTPVAASGASLPVKVFNYPGLNNAVGDLNCSNENQNLIEIINALDGYSVDGQLQSFGGSKGRDGTKPAQFTVDFFSAQLDDAIFFVMTDMEAESPSDLDFYPEAARGVLRTWVEAGGILLMTGTAGAFDTTFLNLTFDWDLTTQSAGSWEKHPTNPTGTPFADVDESSLPAPSATDSIGKGTVPNFLPMWGTDDNATVAVISRGTGKVIFLGFDYFSTGLDSSSSGDGSGTVCSQNGSPLVQKVLPAALNYARDLSIDRIPAELRGQLGLGGSGGTSQDPTTTTINVAVQQSTGLSGTNSLLVRDGQVVPTSTTSNPSVGPRGGLVIEDEARELRVSVASTGGTSPTGGVVVAPDGEIVCEICARLAAGSVVEAWIYSTPRLAAAVRVDVEEGVCPLLRIPVGAPLDGGGSITPGVHTLQLRMYTPTGFEVLSIPITVGSGTAADAAAGAPVPSSVPTGGGPRPLPNVLVSGLLVALLMVMMTLGYGGALADTYSAVRRVREVLVASTGPIVGRTLHGFDALEQRLEELRSSLRSDATRR